jgi:hypothetical protein
MFIVGQFGTPSPSLSTGIIWVSKNKKIGTHILFMWRGDHILKGVVLCVSSISDSLIL